MYRSYIISYILKSVSEINVINDFSASNVCVSLLIDPDIVGSQHKEDNLQKDEAAQDDGKCQKISRSILVPEALRANGVAHRPEDEVAGNDSGFLRLTSHVSGDEG